VTQAKFAAVRLRMAKAMNHASGDGWVNLQKDGSLKAR
jgi:hypothetical protein